MLRARDLKRHQKQGPGLWTVTFSLLILSIFIGSFIAPKAWATPQQVKVNVTHFPPFYVVKRGTAPTGLGIDLINAMNEIQSKYRFETIETSPRRRHPMFEKGFYDVSLFDHLAWGWNKDKVEATSVYLTGGERFIALSEKVISSHYFSDLTNKKIGAIRGYHYSFSDYESDPNKLEKRFNITLVNKQEQIIKLVLSSRVEIGVITETYLKKYLQANKQDIPKISVSKHYDQAYNFVGIVRKNGPISAHELEKIIRSVLKAPVYRWIKTKYGIDW